MKSHYPAYYLILSLTTGLFLFGTAAQAGSIQLFSDTPQIAQVQSD